LRSFWIVLGATRIDSLSPSKKKRKKKKEKFCCFCSRAGAFLLHHPGMRVPGLIRRLGMRRARAVGGPGRMALKVKEKNPSSCRGPVSVDDGRSSQHPAMSPFLFDGAVPFG